MDIWMVRCEGGALYQKFVKEGAVAIAGRGLGSILNLTTRKEIKAKVAETWQGKASTWHGHATGVFLRFKAGIEVGDFVITYDKKQRIYSLGRVMSEYEFDIHFDKECKKHIHIRKVKWNETIFRDELSAETKSKLGSRHTVYRIREQATEEILAISGKSYV